MKSIKLIIRYIILPLLVKLRFDKILLRRTKKSFCIINFHGVKNDETPILNNRHISSSEFEKTIKYLKANYNIVKLSELFDFHRNFKKSDRKTIALTFDDGFRNNFEVAFPILKKYNTPATFYLITRCLEDENYIAWPEKYELIRLKHSSKIEINGLVFEKNTLFDENNEIYLVDYLKTLGINVEQTINNIFKKYNFNLDIPSELNDSFKLITASELKKFAFEPLLEFGSHTHTHPCLEYLNGSETESELFTSKNLIEKSTGKKVVSLAFPDGSYNDTTLLKATELGYTNLVAVNYKNNENNNLPNLLSRFTISNSTTAESNILRLAKQFNQYSF